MAFDLGLFNGLRLIRSAAMVIDTGERSWARVRSQARARRRLKRGHRQNIDIVWAPDPNLIVTQTQIIGHPAMIQKLIMALFASRQKDQPHD